MQLLFLLLVFLLHLVHRLLRELLPRHPLDDVLLPRPSVTNRYQQACSSVHRDGADKDDGRQRSWPCLVRDAIRASA